MPTLSSDSIVHTRRITFQTSLRRLFILAVVVALYLAPTLGMLRADSIVDREAARKAVIAGLRESSEEALAPLSDLSDGKTAEMILAAVEDRRVSD
jgi:hypothetical protein